jgi:hypothetical protein
MPSFPVQPATAIASTRPEPQFAAAPEPILETPTSQLQTQPAQPEPTTGAVVRTAVQSIPAPGSNQGIWIEFQGARWHSAGKAVMHSPDRFRQVGEYHGFPVYREQGREDRIYVPAVRDGALTPYGR